MHVWGVVEVTLPPSAQASPQPTVVWHRVNEGTRLLEEKPPRENERDWALTDVEVVGWDYLQSDAYSPQFARALVQLGGCVAAPAEARPFAGWRHSGVRSALPALRGLAVLQALKLAHTLALRDATRLEAGARAATEAGVWRATAALYRRVLMAGEGGEAARVQEFGQEQVCNCYQNLYVAVGLANWYSLILFIF
jgi:hypothetical protein